MRQADNDELIKEFVNSLSTDNPKELLTIAGDATISAVFDVGTGVPVVSAIRKLCGSVGSIRDRFYARKVLSFMAVLWEQAPDQTREFIRTLDAKEGGQEIFGETILLLLERLDHMKKPKVVGRIFRDCILGKMDVSTAFRLASSVDRAYWYDLVDLSKHLYDDQLGDDVALRLNAAGLVEISMIDVNGGISRSVTDFGKLLVKTALLDAE